MKKSLKISVSVLLLAVVLFAAVPKYYVHQLLGHHHEAGVKAGTEATVAADKESRDCDFEKFDTPVYYTVFKFIVNFIPFRSSEEISFAGKTVDVYCAPQAIASLRGPPAC